MHYLLTLALGAQLGAALPPDSIETLRRRARTAEARFERLARQLAPVSWNTPAGYECDEIVGRFCLRFDSTLTPPAAAQAEAGRVVDARREAVEAIRRYFSAAPAELRAAGPLVRLLIRDGRAPEAVSGADAFAVLSGDALWGDLLLGLAQHWVGADSAAERHFVAALHRLPAGERREWVDPGWLLESDERSRLRRLPGEARADYERRYWLLADPFWLTPANERWNEHIARHVETRLLAEVPVVAGMVSWGRDLDELTIRYGTPTTRARIGATATELRPGMVEYWDTAQRAYDPIRMLRGIEPPPPPGARPVLYAAAPRSAYAMQSIDRVLEPAHQVTRFLRRDSVVLRVDAVVPLDSVSVPPRTGLFAFDSAFTRRSATLGVAPVIRDTARIGLFLSVPPGPIVYSAELLAGPAVGARARYALDTRIPDSGPVLSDLLITQPFAAGAVPERFDDPLLQPLTELVVGAGDTLGIYAELYRAGAAEIEVEVALEPAGRPAALVRFGRWLGRSLGIVRPRTEPRVAWRAEPGGRTHVISLNLPLEARRTGMHELIVRVGEPGNGARAESRRLILIRP